MLPALAADADPGSSEVRFTMSRYCFVLLAGLAAAAPVGAATWADSMFDELSKDFGSVPHGSLQTHNFRLVNNTKQPVNITDVQRVLRMHHASAAKTYLNPGEETAVVARMDTSRFFGVRSVTVTVQFDRPAFEEVRLYVQANSRTDFGVAPDALAFGEVKRTETPSVATTVTFYGSATQITDVKSESNYVQPTIAAVKTADGGTAYQLTAKLRDDVPVGRWYTDVWLKTNNPEIPQIRVPVTVEIASALSAQPRRRGPGASGGERRERAARHSPRRQAVQDHRRERRRRRADRPRQHRGQQAGPRPDGEVEARQGGGVESQRPRRDRPARRRYD